MSDIKLKTELKKLLIAVDFDDVIFDCNNTLEIIISNEFGYTGTYSEFVKDNPTMTHEVFDYVYGKYHHNSSPVSGAIEALSIITSSCEMIIITSRSETIKPQTMSWLSRKFPGIFSEIYFTNSFLPSYGEIPREKHDICVNLGISILIEDSYEIAISAASHDIAVLLIDKPWNREFPEHKDIFRVKNWIDVIDFLKTYKNRSTQ